MATKMYLRRSLTLSGFGAIGASTPPTDPSGANAPSFVGLSASPGASLNTSSVTNTVAGPTSGIGTWFTNSSGTPMVFVSPPLAAAVTIAGTITYNFWGVESAMTANAGFQGVVKRITSTGAIGATVSNSERGTEMSSSGATVNNWTDAAPTSTAFSIGDRIMVMVCINDAGGTMNSGATVTLDVDGPTTGSDGDSYVQFTEALSFQTDPAGSKFYLLDTASDLSGAEKKSASTTAGSGSVTATTNSANSPTNPQVTDTAGGTALEWYTPQLNAFTLAGMCQFNVRATEPAGGAHIRDSVLCEVAIVNSDGSGASVWGSFCENSANETSFATCSINSTSDGAQTVYVSGTDTAVTQGQRLRFRIYLGSASGQMTTGYTVAVSYNGASGGAAGDTYVVLPQTVTSAATLFAQPCNLGNSPGMLSQALAPDSWRRRLRGILVPDLWTPAPA